MPQNIHIANKTIGPDAPCFIAAEIGINHNGDMDLAERMIRAAAEAGADAVKFQNYHTEDFVTDHSLMLEYRSRGEVVRESQYDLFKRCELGRDDLTLLARCCADNGVIFFSTPTGQETLDDLLALGVPLLKNGSDYLGHLPLIRAMARSGVPTILSTGMATLAEMDDAVRAFREAGGNDLILLHCTSSYPTPDDQVNLRKIPAMQAAFGCLTGFSDHTSGIVAALGAVTLGACMVEKHFTLDRGLPGPDHWFSATPEELRDLVRGVRTLEASLGHSSLGPTACEKVGRNSFRLSCAARVALPAGHQLHAQDVTFQRPGTGLPPSALDWILHARLKAPVAAGHIFIREDFQ
jgi:N-acetylneuraminate synthase/N,N'-diacetyllegionaminate synthase